MIDFNEQLNPNNLDTRTMFPRFYTNPTIRSLAEKPKWTVSDKKKKPVDFQFLVERCSTARGARPLDPSTMTTLDILTDTIPNSQNAAFYLDWATDDFICIDVEKTCSSELKEKFRHLRCAYAETSLSGLGYHIFVPVTPELLTLNPKIFEVPKIQNRELGYEILLTHWVTFTRWELMQPTSDIDYLDIVGDFIKDYKPTKHDPIDIDKLKPKNTTNNTITFNILEQFNYNKTPASFNNDHSAYEFGFAISLIRFLLTYLKEHQLNNIDDTDIVWIVADVMQQSIEHRPKHDETRNGLPWLVYNAANALSALQHEIKHTDKLELL